MKKTNQKKQSKKKNNRVVFVISGLAVATILLIFVGYPIFSNWKNALHIPEIPNLSGQPQIFENYIKEMHSGALENPESDQSVGQLGMTFHANIFYEEAERCYIRAMTLNPEQWRWPYYLALINEELGDAQGTIKNLKKSIEINPGITQAWFRLGKTYLKQNAYEEAVYAFNKVLAKQPFLFNSTSNVKLSNKGAFPLKPYAFYNIGRIKFQQGKYDEALQTLTALIKTFPTFGSAYRLLSQVYSLSGEDDKATFYSLRAGDFERYIPPADVIYDDLILYSRKIDFLIKQIDLAIKSQNDDWAVTLNRHIMEFKTKNKEVVTKLLKLSVELNQKEGIKTYGSIFSEMFKYDESRLLEITRFLIAQKRYKLALFRIERIKKINPESMGAHLEYVSVLRNTKKYQEAVDYCKNLIVFNPNNPHIKIELARILIYQHKYNEAAEQLSLAVKIDPNNKAYLLLQGKLLRAQNRAAESIEFYRKYLKTNSTNVSYNLELGNYYLNLHRWKKALKHFEALLKTSPNQIDYIEYYAWILAACPNPRFRNGQKAMEFAERLIVMRKYSDEHEFRCARTLAVAFAELKNFENALKIVNDNLIIWRTKNVEDYYNKFRELQRLFQSQKPYRL